MRLAFFPGGTAEQYDALARETREIDAPGERLVFAAGQAAGGWQVVQVWTSRAALDAFNAAVLLPALARLGGAGFPAPPTVVDFETHDLALVRR